MPSITERKSQIQPVVDPKFDSDEFQNRYLAFSSSVP